jgi:formate dehydrogenase maturation protein FdhE
MYCGNENHRTLGYLYGVPRYADLRAEVCDKCRGYLKVIVSFHPTPADILPIEDLATLHLDYSALERGYARVAIEPAAFMRDGHGRTSSPDTISEPCHLNKFLWISIPR